VSGPPEEHNPRLADFAQRRRSANAFGRGPDDQDDQSALGFPLRKCLKTAQMIKMIKMIKSARTRFDHLGH
jgi:hypothetical protein